MSLLSQAYRATRSLETMENYDALADSPDSEDAEDREQSPKEPIWVNSASPDEHFWSIILDNPRAHWDREFWLETVALSEWVARVPGLYWSEGASALRELGAKAVEYRSRGWKVLKPLGKSQVVSGGIGTLKLPPNEQGLRIVTLTQGLNASSGIPAVIFPAVWEHCRFQDGAIVSQVRAKWQEMDEKWAVRFPSIKGIPRGYLVLQNPDQCGLTDMNSPALIHPCTVMEYAQDGTTLWDFVYVRAITGTEFDRGTVERFFAEYKDRNERYGRYLLSPDIGDPLFDADYESPADLRHRRAHFELLKARVQEVSVRAIKDILNVLTSNYDNDRLQTLGGHIGIPPAQWALKDRVADSAAELLQICRERKKVEELVDAIAKELSDAFVDGG